MRTKLTLIIADTTVVCMRELSTRTGTTVKCLRCGRTRHFHSATAAAKAAPYGRICGALVRAAQMAETVRGFAATQVEKARELIADGGLIPVRGQIFRAVSSKGDRTYTVAATGQCTCPAAARSGRADRCYHVVAARMVALTVKAA